MAPQLLFSVPISTGGKFEVSSPTDNVYIMTFESPVDNRITPAFLKALLLALDVLERKYPRGVLITTSAIPKFYSNGFNLQDLVETPRFFEDYLLPALRRLLTYPMVTISVLNSHAFGAGVFLALAHDYTLMNPKRGWWCLPEVDLGVAIPSTIVVFLKAKIPSLKVYRDAVLQGSRIPGPKAAELGLVDGLGGVEEALKMAEDGKFVEKAKGGAIGGLKEDLWREVIEAFEKHSEQVAFRDRMEQVKIDLGKEADIRIKAAKL